MDANSQDFLVKMTPGCSHVQGKEINHYLSIDAAIRPWYNASPACALNLAELHMDAVVNAVGG